MESACRRSETFVMGPQAVSPQDAQHACKKCNGSLVLLVRGETCCMMLLKSLPTCCAKCALLPRADSDLLMEVTYRKRASKTLACYQFVVAFQKVNPSSWSLSGLEKAQPNQTLGFRVFASEGSRLSLRPALDEAQVCGAALAHASAGALGGVGVRVGRAWLTSDGQLEIPATHVWGISVQTLSWAPGPGSWWACSRRQK